MSTYLNLYLKPKDGNASNLNKAVAFASYGSMSELFSLFHDNCEICYDYSDCKDKNTVEYQTTYSEDESEPRKFVELSKNDFDRMAEDVDESIKRVKNNISKIYKRIALTHSSKDKDCEGNEYDLLEEIENDEEYLVELYEKRASLYTLMNVLDEILEYSNLFDGILANYS